MKIEIGNKYWVFPDEYEGLINDLIQHVRDDEQANCNREREKEILLEAYHEWK